MQNGQAVSVHTQIWISRMNIEKKIKEIKTIKDPDFSGLDVYTFTTNAHYKNRKDLLLIKFDSLYSLSPNCFPPNFEGKKNPSVFQKFNGIK